MKVLGDPGTGLLPAGIGGSGAATEAQMAADGGDPARGAGAGRGRRWASAARTRPGAPMSEIERMFRVAAEGGARRTSTCAAGWPGCDETIAAANAARAAAHRARELVGGRRTSTRFLAAIQAARDAGQDVTTEAYPYGAGMTEIQSALFDDWASWPDERFGLHQLVSTGERLTRATFEKARKTGRHGDHPRPLRGSRRAPPSSARWR